MKFSNKVMIVALVSIMSGASFAGENKNIPCPGQGDVKEKKTDAKSVPAQQDEKQDTKSSKKAE